MVDSTVQGKLLVLSHSFTILHKMYSEQKQFAMMAAQGLDVLWHCSRLCLVCLVVSAAGSNNGM